VKVVEVELPVDNNINRQANTDRTGQSQDVNKRGHFVNQEIPDTSLNEAFDDHWTTVLGFEDEENLRLRIRRRQGRKGCRGEEHKLATPTLGVEAIVDTEMIIEVRHIESVKH